MSFVGLGLVVGLAVTVSCGAPSPPAAPSNVPGGSPGTTAEVQVDPAGPMGALALPAAGEPPTEAPHWIARTSDAAAVVPTPAPLAAGTTYKAISASGASIDLTAGAATMIGYGCDRTPLEVVPLAGAAVPPALVWVLPAPVPAAWSPAAVPLALALDTRAARRWTAGPLVLALERLDRTHARLRISRGEAVAHDERAEAYEMDGAGPIDLDLTAGARPGIPVPEAVFAFAADGPFLVVLDRSGYEGVAFETLLVDGRGRARAIESLGLGVYFCAF